MALRLNPQNLAINKIRQPNPYIPVFEVEQEGTRGQLQIVHRHMLRPCTLVERRPEHSREDTAGPLTVATEDDWWVNTCIPGCREEFPARTIVRGPAAMGKAREERLVPGEEDSLPTDRRVAKGIDALYSCQTFFSKIVEVVICCLLKNLHPLRHNSQILAMRLK